MKNKTLIPLLLVAGCMASCTTYKSKPGRIENLVGTYKLVTYEMKHEEVTDGDNTYDKQKEIGAVAYFSISQDGYAFYGYKDNSTAPKVNQMFVTFSYSEKKPNLVEAIKMTDGMTSKYDDQKCPGCLDEPKMGFKSELFKKSLNYTVNSGHRPLNKEIKTPYRHVEYKIVSKEASLAKVNEYMGTNVTFNKPYEMNAMTGFAVYTCYPKDGAMGNRGLFEYAVLDLDSYSNGELTITYSLKSEPGRQTKKVSVSVEEKGKSIKFDGFGKTFHSSNSNNPSMLSIGDFATHSEDYAEEDLFYNEFFNVYSGEEVTLDGVIEHELASLI
jgi:hypothetical protein